MSIGIVFSDYFKAIEDPRQLIKVLYPLDGILLLALGAVISGAESFMMRIAPSSPIRDMR